MAKSIIGWKVAHCVAIAVALAILVGGAALLAYGRRLPKAPRWAVSVGGALAFLAGALLTISAVYAAAAHDKGDIANGISLLLIAGAAWLVGHKSPRHGNLLKDLSGLLAFIAVIVISSGAGAQPAKTARADASRSATKAPATTPQNPFIGLSGGALLQLQDDLSALLVPAGTEVRAESDWWNAQTTAQYELAGRAMASQQTNVNTAANGLLSDVASLTRAQQKRLAPMVSAASDIQLANGHLSEDTTTPWSGADAAPGVTKAVVAARLAKDIQRIVSDEGVLIRYQVWDQAAYLKWLDT